MVTVTISEAKTNLSQFFKKAQAGETVIITFGRDKKPIAKLGAIQPVPMQRLGIMEDPTFVLTDAFWEDLLPGWDGEGEGRPHSLSWMPLASPTSGEASPSQRNKPL
jgi:antitoxin (DNA-binding transcriptional repressor) of toxin-antitoxin stability system